MPTEDKIVVPECFLLFRILQRIFCSIIWANESNKKDGTQTWEINCFKL